MKKFTKVILSLALVFVLVPMTVLFSGCTKPEGKWELERVEYLVGLKIAGDIKSEATNKTTYNVGDELDGSVLSASFITFELVKGGTGTIGFGERFNKAIMWEKVGNVNETGYEVDNLGSMTYKVAIDGNNLVLVEWISDKTDAKVYYFKKA